MQTTDKYDALGMPLPVPWTSCKGGCEGVGVHPYSFNLYRADLIAKIPVPRRIPQIDEDGNPEPYPPLDGYLIVECMTCKGTGFRVSKPLARILGIIYGYIHPLSWIWIRHKVKWVGDTFWDALRDTPHMVRFMWGECRPYRKMLRR